MIEAATSRRRMVWRPRTIRGLAIAIALMSALVTAALGLMTYGFVHEELERQIDERLETETNALLQYEREHGFDALLEAIHIRDSIAAPVNAGKPGLFDSHVDRSTGYIVLDIAGTRRAGTLQAPMPPPGWSEFVHFTRRDGSAGVAQAINSPLPEGGRLLVAADRAIVGHMDFVLLRLFMVAFGVVLLLGVLASLAFGRIIRCRLRALETLAGAVIGGDISQRMPIEGPGVELDRIAVILNQMLDRIAVLVADLRALSSGLAHELRTPLSRLQARLERAETLAATDAQRETLKAAGAEADHLLKLLAGLLAVVEVDGKAARSRFVPVDLADAVEKITEAYRPAMEDTGLVLTVETEAAMVHGDRVLLQQLVSNLLDNAVVHTPRGTSVAVSLRRGDRETALLCVADNGPGVAAEDHGRIFDRLVRLGSGGSKPGHGLGLSMVAAIVSAHNGTARVAPAVKGLVIEIMLPTSPSSRRLTLSI